MNFLADESVDRQIVDRLRERGHSVIYIAEIEPSIEDDEVFDRANALGALLVTADKDFGEIVFRDRRLISGGVILIRLAVLSPIKKADIVSVTIDKNVSNIEGHFSVISPGKFRSRRDQSFSPR